MHLIDWEKYILVVHRNDFLSREIACAVIEIEKITKHQTTLPSAYRTIDRIRNRHPVIEIPIDFIDGKLCAAGRAGVIHYCILKICSPDTLTI